MLPGLIDLASELLGGCVIAASDEFFASKDDLIKAAAPIFIPDKYTERGKWMDGWETRRKRTPGHDWCIIQLGAAGIARILNIDTSHFLGNFPAHCSLDGASVDGEPDANDWTPVLRKSRLEGGRQNIFDSENTGRLTHVRLNIFPDGGVARLRVLGDVVPDLEKLKSSPEPVDVAAVMNGGRALAASDEFFGSLQNLILPGRPINMGGGWETRRRRGPGNDWIIIQLGVASLIQQISVETEHYKGNYPDRCSIDVCFAPGAPVQNLIAGKVTWHEILPAAKLEADAARVFESELTPAGPATHVRLNIYPDGGISRLRVFGKIVE
ncbi:MAG TPA: allantoicase [Bryobacteraceae bacterium]|jgi:allantoicase|nr:allantoicase [Bryobacteraceae bacterium]